MFSGEKDVAGDVWLCVYEALKKTPAESWENVTAADKAELDVAVRRYESQLKLKRAGEIDRSVLVRWLVQCLAKLQRVRQTMVETKLLIAGFDKGNPHLFILDKSEKPHRLNKEGFAIIGDGDHYVEKFLTSYVCFKPEDSLVDVIFKLCAAKFMGEAHRAVGKKTCVTIHNAQRKWWILPPDEVAHIREMCRRAPPDAKELIDRSQLEASIDDWGELHFPQRPS